jgi:hypothetical protein
MASSVSILSGNSNWLADTMNRIKRSQTSAGIMGALQNSNDGSINSFLSSSQAFAGNFATIAQTGVTSASSFYAQIASQTLQERQTKQLEEAFKDLQRTQNMVQPTNVLDSYIYFEGGSYLDTANNILTMSDGTKVDTITGAKVVDSDSIIQMANGAYLDTKNNILTMSDGTQIDTVTGIKITDLEALDGG